MSDSKFPPPKAAGDRAKTTATTAGVADTPRADARALWDARRADLMRLDPQAVATLPGNLQLSAMAALNVAAWCKTPSARARFEQLAAASLFDLANLDRLDEAASLALYAASRYKAAKGVRSAARLPAALDESSKELRDRMFSCAEHALEDDAGATREVDRIRAGSGYLDRANDLVALAELYRQHPKDVRLDGKKFRETDEGEALSTAEAIFRALGVEAKGDGEDWRDLQHRAWVELATRYREVRRWGLALFADEPDVDERLPDLVAASRSARKAPNKPAADDGEGGEPDAPADDAPKPA